MARTRCLALDHLVEQLVMPWLTLRECYEVWPCGGAHGRDPVPQLRDDNPRRLVKWHTSPWTRMK